MNSQKKESGIARLYLVLTLLSVSVFAYSQTIDLSSGLLLGRFYDINSDPSHVTNSYFPGIGYNITGGYSFVMSGSTSMHLTMSMEEYQGSLIKQYEGLATEYRDSVSTVKKTLSFGFFPFYFTPVKNLNLGFGLVYTRLLSENYSEYKEGWEYVGNIITPYTIEIDDSENLYGLKNVFGVQGLISYDIRIFKWMSIMPSYTIYLGLSNETLERYKSLRHNFNLGLRFDL